MSRRDFLLQMGAAGLLSVCPGLSMAIAPAPRWGRLLVLVELKGGNDSLNTVVPFRDPGYKSARPRLALPDSDLIPLSDALALHAALSPVMPLWERGQLAIVQGLGYPQPNLSHFRSIEIWDTASRSDEYLEAGWLSRSFQRWPLPPAMAADALVLGSADLGPVAGGARAITLDAGGNFERQARLAKETQRAGGGALAHVLKVEGDVLHAARSLAPGRPLQTSFPNTEFGRNCRLACETLARSPGVGAIRLSLGGFDTHQNQLGTQANLLRQLAEGLYSLHAGLNELGRWEDSLIMTYAEFGRRVRENDSGGTDHGTAASHFVLGGRVRGGLHGRMPSLADLDEGGNLRHHVDFRQLYATVLERWWGVADSSAVLGGRFAPLVLV